MQAVTTEGSLARDPNRQREHGARDAIHVAFAADAGYAMPLSVAVHSAAANCDRRRRLVVHIFQNDMDAPLQRRIEASLPHDGPADIEVHWHRIDLECVSALKLDHAHINHLTYVRLIIPDLLGPDVHRLIYLDSDIVVLGDLAELWDTDCRGATLSAVRDRTGTVSAPGGLLKHRELGIPPQAPYFNAGVLLIDLDRWREHTVRARVFRYLHDYRPFVQMGDQDGLNAVLFDDWNELDFRWNWQVVPDPASARAAGCWGLDLTEKAIVHYVTSVKPWVPWCGYEERHLFFRYVDRTAWAGWRVPRWRRYYARTKDVLRSGLARRRA